MWWQDFHFLRPWILLGLFIPLFIGFKIWKSGRIQSSWAKVCDENLLEYLLVKGQNQQRKLPVILALIISSLIILAISGPTWEKKQNPALMISNPVMFVLNLSSDMMPQDVSPNRLDRAKLIIRELTQTLKGAETGLVVYSHEPFMITPLAEDAALIESLLGAINTDIMPINGDRLDRAIDLSVERMQQAGYYKGNLIILTADVGERFDAALASATVAKQKGFNVNVIKVKAATNDKLAAVAQKGGGLYLNYNQNMTPLINQINDVLNKEILQSENMQNTWEDAGYYIFWLPALLLLYYFRRGVLAVIVLLMWTHVAEANWFLNDNQEAMQLFKSEQYEAAAQKFKNAHWQAAAAYKSGDYEQALKQFSAEEGLDALYNQGNALAKSGKIKEAIAKYEEVLAQDDKFEDARFNLEYLKRQQQQQNNQQKDNRSDNNKNQTKQNEQASNQDQQKQNSQPQQNQEQQKSGNHQQQNQDNSAKQQEQRENEQNKAEQPKESTAQPENIKDKDNTDDQSANEKNGAENNNQSDKSDNQSSKSDNPQDSNSDTQPNQNDAENNNLNQDHSSNSNSEPQTEPNNQSGQQEAPVAMSDEEGNQEAEAMQAQIGKNESQEEKEKYRARMQRFREIPEDKGGLLRAFIKKEYNRRRYKD